MIVSELIKILQHLPSDGEVMLECEWGNTPMGRMFVTKEGNPVFTPWNTGKFEEVE